MATVQVECSNARATDTGVEGGVDVDVAATSAGRVLVGVVTLLPAEDGRPRYVSWGHPENWVSSPLLSEIASLPHAEYREVLGEIEAAAAEAAGPVRS